MPPSESLAPVEVVNTSFQLYAAREAGLPDVAITARDIGFRTRKVHGWSIWSPNRALPECNHDFWKDTPGSVVFRPEGEESHADCLRRAQQFAREHYGVEKFARNRMSEYIDARVNKRFPLRKG